MLLLGNGCNLIEEQSLLGNEAIAARKRNNRCLKTKQSLLEDEVITA